MVQREITVRVGPHEDVSLSLVLANRGHSPGAPAPYAELALAVDVSADCAETA